MYRFTSGSIVLGYRALDVSIALISLALVLIVGVFPRVPHGFGAFLEMRITIKNLLLLSGLMLAWPFVFSMFRLYCFDELVTWRTEVTRVAKACATGTLFVLAFPLFSNSGAIGIRSVLAFWVVATIGTACARAAGRRILKAAPTLSRNRRNVVIVGTGPRARRKYSELAVRPGYHVLGFVDTVVPTAAVDLSGRPFLGTLDALEDILVHRPVDEVFNALPVKSCYAAVEQVIATCERMGVELKYLADIFEPSRADARQDSPTDLVVAMKMVADDYRLSVKRAIDTAGALIGLVCLLPLMLTTAVVIKLTSAGPVFFTQERYGYNRRRFRMYKFRTMVAEAESLQAGLEASNEADGPVFKLRRDPRVTPVGRLLRKTSIDELPQLINVLTGDMSLVGPRPLPLRDVSRFPETSLMRRFSVKPGLTCLWQINGRSNAGFDRWIEMDLKYIDHWSLTLDFEILAKTVPAVLKGSGAR